MLRVQVYGFYHLAAKIRPISQLTNSDKYGTFFLMLFEARRQIRGLLDNEIVAVKTCRAAGEALISAISSIVPETWFDAAAKDSEGTLDTYVLWQLQKVLSDFETILAAELDLVDTYSVSKKGAYSTADLIQAADVMFPESIRKRLSQQAIDDVRQAGKCLAFETATAAGFHIFRAIESVMGVYYEAVTGKSKPTRLRNWGVYINKMRKHPDRADAKIVEMLDHIRDKYRNPITHPEETVSLEDVLVLLGLAVSVITLMVRASKALPPLPTAPGAIKAAE
jgi:hypothetical protein